MIGLFNSMIADGFYFYTFQVVKISGFHDPQWMFMGCKVLHFSGIKRKSSSKFSKKVVALDRIVFCIGATKMETHGGCMTIYYQSSK